jgi:tetratricopeptide (TPR) repeat protein
MAAGFLAAYRGDFARAIQALEHGMILCETTGARLIFGWVASYLGFAYAHSGRIADGISLLEQGVDALTALSVMLRRSLVIGWLGEAYLLAGRVDEAADCAAQALDLARAQKERGQEAEALRLGGDVALCHASPEIEKAADAYQLALLIGEELEMRPLQARCHLGLGTMHMRSNDEVRAREHLSTASVMFAAMGMQYWQEKATCEIARLRL